jgi:CubicO group peptidase (beta-lactamase class C family)
MTIVRTVLIAAGSAALCGPALPAQEVALPTAAMDTFFARLGRFGASGAVLVAKDGRVIYRTGFGWADRDRQIPMSTAMGVDIASMSKDVTAVAILQLVERGLLRTTDSLAAHFDSVPPDKRAITVAQLLTHRSGLPQYFVDTSDFARLTRAQALKAILAAKLEFVPGTGEEYSDAGYVLLAILLERRTGLTLESWSQREQFSPAKMTRTFSYGSPALRAALDVAHGYLGEKDAGSPSSYVADADYWVVKGAGGIVSTVEDIALWEAALRSGKLVSAQTLRALLGLGGSDTTVGFAGAPESLPSGKRGWIRTGAQDFGFAVGAIRYADDRTVVVVALNRQPEAMDISYPRTRLLMQLDGFVAGVSPVMPPNGHMVPRTLSTIAGTYMFRDSSTVRIALGVDGMVAEPDGPLAVELFTYSADTAGRAHRLALAGKSTVLLARFCRGDVAALRETLARPSERIDAYLKKTVCADSTATIRAIGSVPRWWTRMPSQSPATLIEIKTATRTARMRFEWEGDRISAVGGGGIVAPVIRVLATSVPDEFVGYHLGVAAPINVSWAASDRDRIVLGGAGAERFVARRIGQVGARTGSPGVTPSTACPFATTDTPFTITCSMPTGDSDGSRYVERSSTLAASKIVISASAPTRRRPFCRIAGTRASSRCAGISVILRIASINESERASRT